MNTTASATCCSTLWIKTEYLYRINDHLWTRTLCISDVNVWSASVLHLTTRGCSPDRSSVRRTPAWPRAAGGMSSGRWGISPSPRLSSDPLHPQQHSLQLLPAPSQSPHLKTDTHTRTHNRVCLRIVWSVLRYASFRANANTPLLMINVPHDLLENTFIRLT